MNRVWAVLATGPSMNQAIADFVRGKCSVVAVSDAYEFAPWADALVSHDVGWWREHPEAKQFKGRKFCATSMSGTELIKGSYIGSDLNSGLEGMRVAQMLGASRILLLGFDMSARNGAHYFGRHQHPLVNTTKERFAKHIEQFKNWRGCEVWNCTPGSALTQFPFVDMREALEGKALRVA